MNFHNTKSGEVYLLGNGPSLSAAVIPDGVAAIGINRSWLKKYAPIHCIVDETNMVDIWAARPAVVFAHERLASKLANYPGDVVLAKGISGRKFSWDLLHGCPISFAGLFGVQVALWLGYDVIHLLGFDEHDGEGRFWDMNYTEDSRQTHRAWFQRVAEVAPARFVVDESSALYSILVR